MGKKGWTFTTLDKAVRKLLQLTRKASCARTGGRRNRFEGKKTKTRAVNQTPTARDSDQTFRTACWPEPPETNALEGRGFPPPERSGANHAYLNS